MKLCGTYRGTMLQLAMPCLISATDNATRAVLPLASFLKLSYNDLASVMPRFFLSPPDNLAARRAP
eukprot:16444413-Heterocapsa_arctica.AAC.1